MIRALLLLFASIFISGALAQPKARARSHGIVIGVLQPGRLNAITDVGGVLVGHKTLMSGNVRTGVTAVIPHGGNVFQDKVPAAVFVGNGFGKMTGISQVQELGTLESPIVLTNTLSIGTAMNAVVDYTLRMPGNEGVQSVNALVGETNDGWLNDIRGRQVREQDVLDALSAAKVGPVEEGNKGAGTGTICFGFKGGIGTSSRVLPAISGGYTVGVLVQTNFGGVLQIDGVPVGEELRQFFMRDQIIKKADGSCMIVVATDAPLDARNLARLAKRAFMGLAKTGGVASNGSGDYVIAFSTHEGLRTRHHPAEKLQSVTLLQNDETSALFLAAIEATEEAIINSLFMAETMVGQNSRTIKAMPTREVIEILKKHNALK